MTAWLEEAGGGVCAIVCDQMLIAGFGFMDI